jgi:hypothetical protein
MMTNFTKIENAKHMPQCAIWVMGCFCGNLSFGTIGTSVENFRKGENKSVKMELSAYIS